MAVPFGVLCWYVIDINTMFLSDLNKKASLNNRLAFHFLTEELKIR